MGWPFMFHQVSLFVFSEMVLAWSKIGYKVCEHGERISGGGPPIGCKGKAPLCCSEAVAIFAYNLTSLKSSNLLLAYQDPTSAPTTFRKISHLIYTDLRDDEIWFKIG